MDWLQEAWARPPDHSRGPRDAPEGSVSGIGLWTAATIVLAVAIAMASGMAATSGPRRATRNLGTVAAPQENVAFTTDAVATPSWLDEINRYRSAAGLAAVTDNPTWDAGIANHLTYMADTPASYLTGQYQSLHTENPASPYFTASGAQEAARSDLFEGAVGYGPVQFIDGWLAAPFHAVGMLRPALQQVAFSDSSTTGDAGLDVIGGLTGSPSTNEPVLFPGPGMVTNLTSYAGNEVPNPLQTCGWSDGNTFGLPLIALLATAPQSGLTAVLTGPGVTESTNGGTLCVVDQHTFVSSDPVYGPAGQAILTGDHAVFMIPRRPLVGGTYTITINQPTAPTISWSFSVVPTVVGMTATPDGMGYWLTDTNGDVSPYGDAQSYGSMSGTPLNAPISHIVSTPDGKGYWLVAADGGIFAFGDAQFYGSMGGKPLNAPVVDLAATPDGKGYWLVAADGGIFAFGDAQFYGSMGGSRLNQPVVGIASDSATGGYWLVASDGGIFAFGVPFYGSAGNLNLDQPVNGMTTTPDGKGYWFVAADGGIFAFGDAQFYGSMGGDPLAAPVVGMTTDRATGGYWLVASNGATFAFNAPAVSTSS